MPTYDYLCEACGHAFELFQSMSAPVKRKCPECGKRSLKRLIGTGAGVLFKGSGFYETDYRTKSYQEGKAADTPKDTPAKDSSSSPSETTSGGPKSGGSPKKKSSDD